MAQAGRWWSKTRGLPKDTHASWTASMAATPARPTRILAWAHTVDGFCLGSPSALSYGPSTDGAAASWGHVGWHEMEHGGWNVETHRLSWTLYGGRRGGVELREPGRLPELFRERVAASIMCERFLPVHRDRGITISARRDLADPGARIEWHTSLGRGLNWQSEGVQALADRALADMRAEYDTGRNG